MKGGDINRILYNKAYLGRMFRSIPKPKGKEVLEIGCSDGLACDLLTNEEPERIVGIDILENVGCNYPHPKIRYIKMDASNLQRGCYIRIKSSRANQ